MRASRLYVFALCLTAAMLVAVMLASCTNQPANSNANLSTTATPKRSNLLRSLMVTGVLIALDASSGNLIWETKITEHA